MAYISPEVNSIFMNVTILKKISVIATKYIKLLNLLKKNITNPNNTNKITNINNLDEKEIKDIEAEIYTDKGLIGGTVYGKKYLIMGHKGSLDEKGTFLASGKSHIINGPAYVRYSRMVKGINDE